MKLSQYVQHRKEKEGGLPQPSPSMAGALGDGEEHNVMIRWPSNSRVLRPVVGEVMDCLPSLRVQYGVLDEAIRVARRTNDLNV